MRMNYFSIDASIDASTCEAIGAGACFVMALRVFCVHT